METILTELQELKNKINNIYLDNKDKNIYDSISSLEESIRCLNKYKNTYYDRHSNTI